jgi:hypothetical protein
MSFNKPCLLSVALLLSAITALCAQAYSDLGSSGPIGIENTTITYAPGTTAVNLWDGDFIVNANGVISGSGILSSFANKQNSSSKTPFTILNGSRATSIQSSTQTSTNGSGGDNGDRWFSISTTTTSTADFNATAQIGSGRRPPTAQFKGIITATKTVYSYTDTGPIVTTYTDGRTPTTNGYYTNMESSTNLNTVINGVIFGPSAQAGYFSAFASTNAYTNSYTNSY